MLGLVLSVGVIGWIIAACLVFNMSDRIQIRLTAEHTVNGIAFLLLIFTSYLLYLAHKNNEDLYGNFATSIGSISITVILIDRLNAWRALQQRKQEIFEEIESRVRDVAVEAVRLTRKYDWLDEALKKVRLVEAQLAGVDLSEANLQGINLSGANLQEANLKKANLQEANLNGAELQGAILNDANLQGADLMTVNLQRAPLWRTNLQDAKLWGARLQGAFLIQANLQGANLKKANLQGSYLSGAELQGTQYDHETLWPEGFSPQEAGAILVES